METLQTPTLVTATAAGGGPGLVIITRCSNTIDKSNIYVHREYTRYT